MAGGKQTPRQKMINMMYLVLTALLALNISKDILDALTKLNISLDQTVQTVDKKNADIYSAFAAAASENPEKAGEWNKKAQEVKQQSDDLYNYIAQLKTDLIEVSGGVDEETGLPKSLDAREKPINYLLNQKHAAELKTKIDAYRDNVSQYVADKPQLQSNIATSFDTGDQEVGKDKVKTSWESANFEHFPLAAILPFLTDYQAKVRNTESDVISELQRNIGKSDLKFTGVRAIVMPKSNYVTQGDEYEAEVFLAAYDDTQEPEITINGQALSSEQIENGKGKVTFKASSVGEQKWAGVIKISQMGKDPIEYPIEASYTVAPPSVVISPTKMNVLYRGVDNPLDIGVPGVDPSKLTVTGPGIKKLGNGTYMADVTNVSGREMSISVSVQEVDENGKTVSRNMGSKEFRVKGLPPAQGSVFGKSEGIMSKSLISKAVVKATYQDFPFDLDLTVTAFEVAVPGFPPEQVRGDKLPEGVKTRISKLRPGSTISIRNIKAVVAGKGTRVPQIGNISIDVN
ncbi:gliding motility protein GldM [Owenweeksia hongkongensis]|uniref:type IX secretion system motor protein PorM/GldM n=1 Tax=Owenweeksia hongkongensis TaxID=253245 RepID=UPI003A8EF8F3